LYGLLLHGFAEVPNNEVNIMRSVFILVRAWAGWVMADANPKSHSISAKSLTTGQISKAIKTALNLAHINHESSLDLN